MKSEYTKKCIRIVAFRKINHFTSFHVSIKKMSKDYYMYSLF